MSDSLLPYYQRELNAIRTLAKEFADANPKIAGRLRLSGGTTLGLGAGLGEVEAVNGRPFAVSGFYWDYGGYATDWKGGTLAALPGGCTLSVRFNPDPKAAGAAADRVSGEKTFSSSSPALKAVTPIVSVLSIDWPE